ncbi:MULTISPECIES: ferredoxin [Streptosporangium]|uniref:Ferredoxin n=1 Tax=Streptosporangium brasiliense TaxID=47480 RepID=A0ABT9QW12_9ACTN|nr:ferredoxin [Streptosporangium brasiliense]MDP9861149.1 ferredoxin [Streptosporangium brasiliense]
MKITIDRARCAGLGICESLAPEYFEVDGDGELVLLREDMPEEDLDGLRAAVEGCPTEALRLKS